MSQHVRGRGPHRVGVLVAAALALVPTLVARQAHATLVERVVAVVDDKAILLSELQARATPFVARIYEQVPAGAQRTAAISQIYATLVERLIEDELKERAAQRAHITIASGEIDRAFERIARQNGMDVADIIAEAKRTGLSEADYRLEVRRQLLEAKLLNVRLQGRLQVTEQDTRSLYRAMVLDERQDLPFSIARIVLDAPTTAGPSALEAVRKRAESIAARARAGADFAELARRYSNESKTGRRGSIVGPLEPGQLPATLDRVTARLEVGEVSNPVRVGGTLVVVKLVAREPSRLPTYEQAALQLQERAYMEKMNRARKQWLSGLRRQTHVEVRL
ncbi:MAG: peptidylprolyl isomerase [Polyangiaceae bacterium]|nr:peptidylprolyl isomerase [Polyangiaceae bacterium]